MLTSEWMSQSPLASQGRAKQPDTMDIFLLSKLIKQIGKQFVFLTHLSWLSGA